MFKKCVAMMIAGVLIAGTISGCTSKEAGQEQSTAGNTSAGSTAQQETQSELAGTKISLLNTKGEIQEALEEIADVFKQETGIEVEIIACGAGESPYTKVTSAYNSGSAPTMSMLDPTDIVALAEEYALDLSDEAWVCECENQINKIEGKVYSFPFCVEGRGIIYNKTAIERALGETFDPSTIQSYDALNALLEQLKNAGMEHPVVVSKEDWSLGAHQLGYIYDTYDGTTAGSEQLIEKLKSGSLKVEDYERFGQFVDTLDLLLAFNINGADPLGASYDHDSLYLADGETAFWANGCWAWPNLAEAGASTEDEYGFLPFILGNDTTDFANQGIQATATKQVMIDAEQASESEIAAAKEFLNWLVYSESGQKLLVERAALIPACSNNTCLVLDPLGKDIQAKMVAGNTYSSSFIAPSDHWSALGAAMQKYIAGESSREELAQTIDQYWAAQN